MTPLHLEYDRENDGRWIAEIPELPGVMAYGATQSEVAHHAQALALRVLPERLEEGETVPEVALLFATAV